MIRRALLVLPLLLAAASVRAETIYIEYTQVPYKAPEIAFLGLHFEGLGGATASYGAREIQVKDQGFGISWMGKRDSNFQLQGGMVYRQRNVSALALTDPSLTSGAWDITVGGRLYPRKPMLSLGNVVVRPTFSGNGGVDLWTGNLIVTGTAGLALGMEDDPTAVVVELIYRPLEETVLYFPAGGGEDHFRFGPSWAIRIGLLFGP